jgi:hypothetical protein
MRRRLCGWGIISALVVSGILTLARGQESEPPPPQHLRDARALVAGIDPRFNDYEHKGCFIHWKGENGATRYENRTDCSDFLNLLLVHSYHFSDANFKQWTGKDRPTAELWHDAILANRGFQHIELLSDALPGDVLAIKYPAGESNTGHVLLVAAVPQRRDATKPIVPDTVQWNVAVIDSSESGHGKSDTRRLPSGKYSRGVGQGTFRIYTDPAGRIVGYAWSDLIESTYRARPTYDIVLGRLKNAGGD